MRGHPWRATLLIALLGSAAVGLQAARERLEPLPATSAGSVLYVRSPELARRAALSYTTLAADAYWLRAVQYYGATKLSTDSEKTYDLLHPLLDLATSLDPRFSVAYRFGAIFLAETPPNGPGRPDLAIELLKKGLREQPDKWGYAEDIGFVCYWWLHDYKQAAEWFARASSMPGAPVWLAPVAAVTLAQGGSRESSRQLWQEIQRSADEDWLRSSAERRLQQLTAMDQIDELRTIVKRYQERMGRPPAGWRDLIALRAIRGVPLDPAGFPYVLAPGTSDVALYPRSTLNPLPVEPVRAP